MSRRLITGCVAMALLAAAWFLSQNNAPPPPPAAPAGHSQIQVPAPSASVPGDSLLAGYADPSSPPLEDLRKIHRVVTGYFSVIKNDSRHPIGGNEDLSAALRGENSNREIFVSPSHPVFSKEGILTDRWGSPLIVHPEAWKQIELHSAGPDGIPYNEDDLILRPDGMTTGVPLENSRPDSSLGR